MTTSPSSSVARSGAQPLQLHQRCELTSYGRGEILFVGQTSFSHGVWVGIALDERTGKHDGVVQGKRYFTAHAGHGIFVRSSQVHLLTPGEEEAEEEEQEDASAPTLRSLPATRQATSRASVASSSARTTSPVKSNVVRTARTSVMPAGTGSFAAARQSAHSPAKRPSSAAPAAGVGRASTSPFKTPGRALTAGRTSTAPGVTPRVSTMGGRSSTASPAKGAVPGVTRTPAGAAARTPAGANVTRSTPASTLTQARSAVQAGRAPDTATARAGLRPVAKTRASMVPPAASSSTSYPRTPARTVGSMTTRAPQTTVARRVPGSAATSSSTRSSTPRTTVSSTPAVGSRSGVTSVSRTDRRPPTASSSTRSSRQPTLDGNEEDETEDLLGMSMDEEIGQTTEFDVAPPDDGPISPSLRKATSQAQTAPDHMSLTRGMPVSSSTKTVAELGAMQREVEELRAKVRIAEKKREEDRETLREAERIQQESEQFLAVKPKMAAKQQELQNELKDLRKLEREWTTQREELERQVEEHNDHVEILSLDKEMAEERAESALEELQMFKDRVEELELDIEVLREENARYESGPVDEKDKLSVGYIQLEKQNERLKEALIRLRDLTAESDAEQKQKIVELEKELRALDELQASYESATANLQQTEALLEDLKIQLDDALGAEEMLEQLTERNMSLTERIDEMRSSIEDLEALKDLNDELEETHIETEKQLQEELDLKEMQMREYQIRNESLEANVVEYDSTFAQFRELVLNLQSENEALRNDEKARDASRAVSGAEEKAMLNLNLKLQSSTLKSQAKTIELEIGKLDAVQAKQHLEVISSYLPKRYFDQDKDAVESLLFFQRIATKSEIIKNVVEGNSDIANSLVGVVDERLIVVCRMRHSLAHFIASSRQIFALVQLASIPTFLKAGRMFKELSSIEKRIDQFIDLLRREELKEDDCAKEYRRFVKMLEEFEFALLEGSAEAIDSDLAAKELGSATLFDLDLDTIAAALGFAKQAIAGVYNDFTRQQAAKKDVNDDSTSKDVAETDQLDMRMNDLDIDEALFTPLQELINHLRSTKVPARKLLRRLSGLYDNGEAVRMEAIVKLPGLGKLSSQLVAFASTLATSFGEYVNNVRTNKVPFELKEILATVNEATREVMGGDAHLVESVASIVVGRGGESWKVTLGESAQLGATVTELLNAATEQENVQKVSGSFPWLGRVEEIRQEQESNAESQRVITKQTEDLRDLFKQIRVRDELIEENRIKIERLGKQLQRSKQDNETVTTLRDDLIDTTKRMKAYEEGNSALQGELEQLQRQYEQLLNDSGSRAKDASSVAGGSATMSGQAAAGTGEGGVPRTSDGVGQMTYGVSSILPSSNYEVSYLVDQVGALRGAVKFLRLENGLLKGRDLLSQVEMLPDLPNALRREDSGVALNDDNANSLSERRGVPQSKKKEGRKTGKGLPTGIGLGLAGHEDRTEARKAAEGKRLASEWMRMASSPRVITLTRTSGEKGTEGGDGKAKRPWIPLAQLPDVQYRRQLSERTDLRRKIEALHVGSKVTAV